MRVGQYDYHGEAATKTKVTQTPGQGHGMHGP